VRVPYKNQEQAYGFIQRQFNTYSRINATGINSPAPIFCGYFEIGREYYPYLIVELIIGDSLTTILEMNGGLDEDQANLVWKLFSDLALKGIFVGTMKPGQVMIGINAAKERLVKPEAYLVDCGYLDFYNPSKDPLVIERLTKIYENKLVPWISRLNSASPL
jgi:hypothetical protein